MGDEDFEKVRSLGDDASRRVNEIMKSRNMKNRELSGIVSPIAELKVSSIGSLIRRVRKGYSSLYMPFSRGRNDGFRRSRLHHLSLIFNALEIRNDDEIINGFRNLYGMDFEYPPLTQEELSVQQSYDSSML